MLNDFGDSDLSDQLGYVADELAELRAENERLRATIARVHEEIGIAFHVALRKASDHEQAHAAWMAISALPPDEWMQVVDYVLAGLGVEEPATGVL